MTRHAEFLLVHGQRLARFLKKVSDKLIGHAMVLSSGSSTQPTKHTHMITKSKQDWSVGQRVKVGFLTLTVVKFIATPGDYRPDIYVLESDNGRRYEFTPHYGLSRIG